MTTAMSLVSLPELRLNQGSITEAIADLCETDRYQTWYGMLIPSGQHEEGEWICLWVWGRDKAMRYGEATHRCVVAIPAILIGSPDEISGDITDALTRHAIRLGAH